MRSTPLRFEGLGLARETPFAAIARKRASHVPRCTVLLMTVCGHRAGALSCSTCFAHRAAQRHGHSVTSADSTILRNAAGVYVGSSNVMSIENTLIDGNANAGAQANGSGCGEILGVFNSVINASPTSVQVTSGATAAASIRPSNAVSGAGGFTLSIPFK